MPAQQDSLLPLLRQVRGWCPPAWGCRAQCFWEERRHPLRMVVLREEGGRAKVLGCQMEDGSPAALGTPKCLGHKTGWAIRTPPFCGFLSVVAGEGVPGPRSVKRAESAPPLQGACWGKQTSWTCIITSQDLMGTRTSGHLVICRFWIGRSGLEAQDSPFLTSSQAMLMFLVEGPHLG